MEVLSNEIYSQIDVHTLYGGVVPEIASRSHVEKINTVIDEALRKANCTLDDIDAVAVTYGPGLVGALLVEVILTFIFVLAILGVTSKPEYSNVAGLVIGKKFGTKLAGKASVLGGVILIAIGIEIFLSGIFS